jgi:hypothetical protein
VFPMHQALCQTVLVIKIMHIHLGALRIKNISS